MRILAAFAGFLFLAAAAAQGPGGGELRTPPPAPAVRSPDAPPVSGDAKAPGAVPSDAAPAGNRNREANARCSELSGALRDQCLLEQQGSAAGTNSAPEPRTAPPPQNPR
jgi:hypothetical protein